MSVVGEFRLFEKIEKELARLKKRLFHSSKVHKQLAKAEYRLYNAPYELYDKITNDNYSVRIPIVKSLDKTMDKVIEGKSLCRFGDGEFVLMTGGRINYQPRNSALAERLKEVLSSQLPDLLVALPPCFGALDQIVEPSADFWRKWSLRKRDQIYSYLDMDRVYYNAFFSRVYMQYNKSEEHYKRCTDYYEKAKKLWQGRDIVICEGHGTRLGMFNDLLAGAKSISRILCPPRNAFAKYDEILAAFDGTDKDKLILISLGPTATILSHDLCKKGFQAVDTGAFDVEYEWFLKKETGQGVPLPFKYVDSGKEGRKIERLDDPEYQSQIIKRIG